MLEFKVCNGGATGRFIDGSIYFTVTNGYITDNTEEHAEVLDKIRRLLNGEQGLTVSYLYKRCDADIPLELQNSVNQIARNAPGFSGFKMIGLNYGEASVGHNLGSRYI